jgi:hypothetical protein
MNVWMKDKNIKDIFDGNHEISKKIIDADNPMIIIG